jgi:hypothetical protein
MCHVFFPPAGDSGGRAIHSNLVEEIQWNLGQGFDGPFDEANREPTFWMGSFIPLSICTKCDLYFTIFRRFCQIPAGPSQAGRGSPGACLVAARRINHILHRKRANFCHFCKLELAVMMNS